jgi:ABC-type molybdate transport system substrate-binding protein
VIFPPWQHGQNNDATNRGLSFSVPQVDDLADFHGDLSDPKLVLYVGGNYFFAMAPLVAAFEQQHPEFRGRIYWETLPPGLLVKQIEAGGTVTSGNMTWTAKADAYFGGLKKVQGLIDQGVLTGPAVPYVTNSLTIMVPAGNPGHVTGLADLARPDIHLVMPNPAFEGIARQIETSLKKTGGDDLAATVYRTKVADGSAVLTQIHHRQTPLFLMQGRAQAGVTWQSEAIFQEQAGHPIGHVDIPAAQNATAIYAGAEVSGAPHADAARLWLSFIRSPAALAIFGRYGFKPYTGAASAD